MKRALAAALVVVALALWLWPRGEFRLPARMRIDEVVADLTATLEPATVVEQAPGAPVRLDGLTPSPEYEVNGGFRRAIVAPPPSLIRLRVRVPPDAKLHVRFGATRPDARRRERGAIRFTLAVDGRELFARDVDPELRKHDRGWLMDEVDLAAVAGREVEVALGTRTVGTGAVGIPAWSQLRVVRERWTDRQPARDEAPNVLVLLVDTLRADRLGCYGARPSPTPNLDRVAENALVFEAAVAQSSWTVPSVASLFTGLYPRSHGVWGAPHDAPGEAADSTFLPDALPILARSAQRAGITTVGVSANPLVSRGTNFAQGFETFVEFGMERRFGAAERAKNWASAADVNERFLAWLRPNRRHRFLAYLHYMEPHDPYTPPDPPPAPPDVRPAIARGVVWAVAQKLNWHGGAPLPEPELAHLRRLYEGEVRAWDAELAPLLAALDRLGVGKSTVIVVTADHGEEFQEHGRLRHGADLYDETVRVPLLIAGPGIHPGRTPDPVQGLDLFPTIGAILGFAAPPAAPGRNLLDEHVPRPAFTELGGGLAAIRTRTWKLIAGPDAGRYELYDLVADPGERQNRFASAAEGAPLAEILARWLDGAPAPPPVAGRDPRILEKLRALGYVE